MKRTLCPRNQRLKNDTLLYLLIWRQEREQNYIHIYNTLKIYNLFACMKYASSWYSIYCSVSYIFLFYVKRNELVNISWLKVESRESFRKIYFPTPRHVDCSKLEIGMKWREAREMNCTVTYDHLCYQLCQGIL